MYKVDSSKCTGCGTCVQSCPEGAVSLIQGKATIDRRRCTGCGQCLEICPSAAIYEVKVPQVISRPSTLTVQPPPVERRPALMAALIAVAPVAAEVLQGLVSRWLSPDRHSPSETGTGFPLRRAAGGFRHRRRRGSSRIGCRANR